MDGDLKLLGLSPLEKMEITYVKNFDNVPYKYTTALLFQLLDMFQSFENTSERNVPLF